MQALLKLLDDVPLVTVWKCGHDVMGPMPLLRISRVALDSHCPIQAKGYIETDQLIG
jgi:hypothetical protein